MDLKTYKFDYQSLEIDRAKIEGFMGYDPGTTPEPFPEMIDEILSVADSFCNIQGGYRLFEDIERDKKNHLFRVNEITFDIKRIISNQLRKSQKAAIFVCTAGPGIGDWSKELMSGGDLMKGYVVDVIGSEIVEKAMDKIQDQLAQEMKVEGLGITDRYSPGYCDWHVSEQQKLFSLFPENYCGIKLSPSSLMNPIKSVSGVIGIGREAQKKGYVCHTCTMKNCIYRRTKPKVSRT